MMPLEPGQLPQSLPSLRWVGRAGGPLPAGIGAPSSYTVTPALAPSAGHPKNVTCFEGHLSHLLLQMLQFWALGSFPAAPQALPFEEKAALQIL